MPRYAHKPLLALRQGMFASPHSLKARLRVLPYLMKMGLGKEEVDGDVVVEEPKLGYYASHRIASFRRYTKKPLLGINRKDPHIHRGSVN